MVKREKATVLKKQDVFGEVLNNIALLQELEKADEE